MKLEMHEFCRHATVPCGFADSEGEIKANAKMVDFLGLNKDAPEMVTLLEKIRTEKSPFFVIINLVSDFKKATKIWQFHFLPLFCSENGYLGTFFHAHEFLFLSPMEYVDTMQPYFCDFRVTVLYVTTSDIPLPRLFARVARSLGCGERWELNFEKIFWFLKKKIGFFLNSVRSPQETLRRSAACEHRTTSTRKWGLVCSY